MARIDARDAATGERYAGSVEWKLSVRTIRITFVFASPGTTEATGMNAATLGAASFIQVRASSMADWKTAVWVSSHPSNATVPAGDAGGVSPGSCRRTASGADHRWAT